VVIILRKKFFSISIHTKNEERWLHPFHRLIWDLDDSHLHKKEISLLDIAGSSISLATQEAEIRRITVQIKASLEQIVH
jgi:hypothetical protein